MESKIEVIKQTFLAGESMNVNNFVKFFTSDCHYKFSNFPEARGPQEIVDSSGEFLKRVESVKHNIIDYVENGDSIVIEMTVDYTMKNGKNTRFHAVTPLLLTGIKLKK